MRGARPFAIALAFAFLALGETLRGAQRSADGTAEVAGTVVTTSSPAAPLARVLVTISGAAITPSRTVITDERGRFVFRGVPAGSFTIVAARDPFVKTAYGAKRPGRPGTPIALVHGQRVDGVTIALPRGAAITGMVRQTSGEPAAGIDVDIRPIGQQPDPLTPRVVTDDRGMFRAFGLSPGSYAIVAASRDLGRSGVTQLTDAEIDERMDRLRRRSAGPAPGAAASTSAGASGPPAASTYRYAPVYFPGTVDPDQAIAVSVTEGEERAGVDITLQLARALTIEGVVTAPPGVSLANTRLTARRRSSSGAVDPSANVSLGTALDSGGRFSYANMLPGSYRLIASNTTVIPGPPSASGSPSMTVTGVHWAMADVSVRDDDVKGVALMLRPGLRMTGRLVFESTTGRAPSDVAVIRLRLIETGGGIPTPPWVTRPDGSFELSGILPGTYTLELLPTAVGNWRLKSAIVNGQDVLDFPLEVGADTNVENAVVTLTDGHSELAGALQAASNTPAPDYFVVIFAADRAFWRPASRRVQFTRPGTDGRFVFRDLPAGDYRIAALTDLEATDLFEAAFIDTLMPASLPLTIHDGQTTTQDLRLR